MAVQDPQAAQQPTHPQVQRLIDAAQVGATVQAAGAAAVAPRPAWLPGRSSEARGRADWTGGRAGALIERKGWRSE